MTAKFSPGLLKDISLMLNNADDYNVVFQIGEIQNTKEFRAHSCILKARSSYFKSAFSTEWITTKNGMIEFKKPNINPNVFEIILKYIYTGEVDLTKQFEADILELLVASDELLLEELFKYVQNYLIEKQTTWIQQNSVLVLQTVFKLTNCKNLQDFCFESISTNALQFFSSNNFSSVDKSILYCLLKRDDLKIEEIAIWDFLIKWGIKQTPGLENKNNHNRDEWIDKNYEDLKDTLSDFISLIKFSKITSEDFHYKVRPYKVIIPNNIYEEAMTYYLVEQPKLHSHIIIPQIESNIIKPKLANIISNWIDNKNPMLIRTERDPLYKFNLIYRGSNDGINNNSFKSKCNEQKASLILVKVQQSNKIFGGYSSIGIGTDLNRNDALRWCCSSDNFIFSFENSEDTHHMKISYVVNNSKAIAVNECGFNFGGGSLAMFDQELFVHNRSSVYESNLNTRNIYYIEEIETFIVEE